MGRQADGDAGYRETGGHTLDLSGLGRGGNNPNFRLLEWKQGQKGKKREKNENPRDGILTSHQQQAAGKGQ